MDNYLKSLRNKLKNFEKGTKVTFVIGNESCDLDSVVCSVTYAYFLQCKQQSELVLPLLQVCKVYKTDCNNKKDSYNSVRILLKTIKIYLKYT